MSDIGYEIERDIERRRTVPQSDIDLQMQLTEPNWSRDITKTMRMRLNKEVGLDDDNKVKYKDLIEMLDIMKRDLRLGNLKQAEVDKCQEGINLALDCLDHGYTESSILLIGRVAAIIDTSQSRKGFLRKLFGTATIRRENIEFEPRKRGLFGGTKKEE